MPEPNKGESRDDWMSRCMSDPEQKKSFPEHDQRIAVCESKFDKKKGSTMSKNRLRVGFAGKPIGVDREKNMILGYVIAQEGPFKSEGRGRFVEDGLKKLVELGNAEKLGIKNHFTHATMSDDGLGKFLGRTKNLFMDKAKDARTGKKVNATRGDLTFDSTALKEPPGGGPPLANYIMDLAESDADALSSSIVVEADQKYEADPNDPDKLATDKDGNVLPPIWTPTVLWGSDIVDTGDAVDGLLSAPELAEALSGGVITDTKKLLRFDNVQRLANHLLNGLFKTNDEEDIRKRCLGWVERYLRLRFGEKAGHPRLDERLEKLAQMRKMMGK